MTKTLTRFRRRRLDWDGALILLVFAAQAAGLLGAAADAPIPAEAGTTVALVHVHTTP
jgi:hypothetical protein